MTVPFIKPASTKSNCLTCLTYIYTSSIGGGVIGTFLLIHDIAAPRALGAAIQVLAKTFLSPLRLYYS